MRSTKVINAQAYEWFLMGQYHWRQRNPESVAKALIYLKQSLELEPDYAEAHIGIAITYSLLHIYGNWDAEKGIEAALPHIHRALAQIKRLLIFMTRCPQKMIDLNNGSSRFRLTNKVVNKKYYHR
jgi:hypothetical protein